ncbi:MAG TPA: 2-polyprenyl-3-methyl-6-methoxy-1,4-benzoquinone monooxygenase [Nevskiaceae bacterium]|nr:2-polyprenyl-3-methyl-6-methoxy-1,4-benzoquinone monooxygenase [Nevskiaceae bacterium]
MSRHYSAADRFLIGLHQRVAALARPAPAAPAEKNLDEAERRHAAGLMRVNHAGEIAAQALYQGQAYTARDPHVREHLLKAAREEEKHLQWCEQRLAELGDAPSALKPLWYAGSFAIGAAAGMAGDRWSLGFVAETEKQVSEHLQDHLQQLPPQDQRSREIVAKMHEDETRHGREALEAGGRELPRPLRALMRQVARVMKFGAYRV